MEYMHLTYNKLQNKNKTLSYLKFFIQNVLRFSLIINNLGKGYEVINRISPIVFI